ncbi:transglycosylase SLT domain-containing protein [Deltaproteobacteria bacterium OttesenSCG-928-K17]|nr:transglycosylase SLT domain-containing protein [Deltaproteobacteria bacterium OttesenSCG-928-K17]
MIPKLPVAALLVLLVLSLSSPAVADHSRHLTQGLSFCGEPVAVNQNEVFQAVDQNLVLLAEAKSRVWLALRRAGRYRPLIEAELKKAGVPTDMVYIPMAITGMAPDYNSGGRGIWRLKDADAKALGLRVDANIDERLDPVASTVAAATRLKNLKASYGQWTTAMAAYLVGEQLISQAVTEAGGEQNFWRLYLPDGLDTLPATVIAGKVVFQNPSAFGYNQSPSRAWPPLAGRRAEVKQATTARAIATQYKIDYKSFRDMNPHLLTGTVPAGVVVNIP